MTPPPPEILHVVVDRAVALLRREASLREAARHLELNPATLAEAAWLFKRADETRRERLDLVARCGLS
jgi:hypothetical protein